MSSSCLGRIIDNLDIITAEAVQRIVDVSDYDLVLTPLLHRLAMKQSQLANSATCVYENSLGRILQCIEQHLLYNISTYLNMTAIHDPELIYYPLGSRATTDMCGTGYRTESSGVGSAHVAIHHRALGNTLNRRLTR